MPAVIYMAAIFTLSSIQGLKPPRLGVSWEDKVYHFIEYAGLGFLLFRAFLYWQKTSLPKIRLILSILLGSLIGAADELYQIRVPNRAGQFDDWLVDAIAVMVSAVVVFLFCLWRKRRSVPAPD